jgi:hypothetical protein
MRSPCGSYEAVLPEAMTFVAYRTSVCTACQCHQIAAEDRVRCLQETRTIRRGVGRKKITGRALVGGHSYFIAVR